MRFTCGHCPARLLVISTPSGRDMTVDATPSRHGNLVVRDQALVEVLGPKSAKTARARGARLHTNHRWTCPASLDPLALAGRQ